ncbi:hypothetical protein SAMN04488096_105197 [Mesonia phycicola]|uniref:Uncharacterized protein n=1 Tax=Mesonia phycicola TaxID=579105 RepID=A0A1M6EQ81_9FLAO|nr:hypothetical protein [Mesonia phycicola]SHI87470.1 hypothetical protein SAMN04488096_105197 [Mesonia phycicola]
MTDKDNYNAYHDFVESKNTGWTYTGPSDLENSFHAILSALWFYQENVLDNIDIDENTTADSKVRIHMHTNYIFSGGLKTETTPSVQDLFGFADFYKTKKDLGADDSEDITSIVVSRRGLYALRIGDPQKVENFASDIDNPNLEDKGVTYKQALKNLYDKNVLEETKLMCNNCPDAYEAALFEMNFIEFVKYIPGIKVFRRLNDGNGNYTWEEI